MSNDPANSSHVLIDGEFSTEEAKSILMTLIEHKIRFHRKENLSQEERFGDSDHNSNRRIDQLLQTKADLATLIDDAQASDERLAINCVIGITRLPQ